MALTVDANNETMMKNGAEALRPRREVIEQLIQESEQIDKEYQGYVKKRKRTLLEIIFGGKSSE